MAFSMNLWKVAENKLQEVQKATLDQELRLENWIANESSILGTELLLIGRQVQTDFGGRIDLLGIDRQGDIAIIELKRDRTPREITAQVLDYASWVKGLTYKDIEEITREFLSSGLSPAFSEHFGDAMPENINTNHRMIVVASDLDDSSERIIRYLAEEHQIDINVIFFSFFQADGQELLGRAWLMDPAEVEDRAEKRRHRPWSGYLFVNVGENEHRNWDDNMKYGFIGAGHGFKASRALKRLEPEDKIFAYMKGIGYVGYGVVTKKASMIKDFVVGKKGKSLLELDLKATEASEYSNNEDLSEWAAGVNWIKTFDRENARWFKGMFANQNIVCKLRDTATAEFLQKEFEVDE